MSNMCYCILLLVKRKREKQIPLLSFTHLHLSSAVLARYFLLRADLQVTLKWISQMRSRTAIGAFQKEEWAGLLMSLFRTMLTDPRAANVCAFHIQFGNDWTEGYADVQHVFVDWLPTYCTHLFPSTSGLIWNKLMYTFLASTVSAQ